MTPFPFLVCLLLLHLPPSHTLPPPPTEPMSYPSPGKVPPPHNPVSMPRQEGTPPNNCSNLPQPCGPFVCCPTTCCPPPFSICPPTPTSPFCLTPSLQIPCQDPLTEAIFPGTPCNTASSRCCGSEPGFDRCADDDGELVCVNEDGFVPCGEPPMPGVTCPGGLCCQNPRRCCEVGGQVSCCVAGDGEALEPRPEVSFEGELIMGVPGVSIEVEFGGDIAAPTMGVEEGTDEPEVSATPQLLIPEESLGPEETTGEELIGEESLGPEESGGIEEETLAPEESVVETTEVEMSEGPETSMVPEASPGVAQVESDAQGGDQDDGPVCFAGDAMVEVRGAGRREMRELRVGDWVRVGDDAWEEVMMWSHWDEAYEGRRYVRVRLDGGDAVKTSEGHVVWAWECAQGCERRAVRAEAVTAGMWMWVVGQGLRRVVGVEQAVWGQGLYNPQTASGGIVVDGVWVSCYTKWIPVGVAHGLLAPVRAMWVVVS